MENSKFRFQLIPTDPAAKLGFEAWINDHCIFDQDHVTQSQWIEGDLPSDDQAGEHVLKLVLKNKNHSHTRVVDSVIVQDAVLEIQGLSFDDIDLQQLVTDHAVYQHNFNGTGAPIKESFFGTMGCNGTVELKFTTPIYLWILENM